MIQENSEVFVNDRQRKGGNTRMAFLDDLGRKISQTGQTALQKTKDMTDVAKINGEISEEERKINNAYLQIGKVYAQTHSNGYEEAFADMMLTVKEAQNKISSFRHQIQDIKGVVRCGNCGAEIANTVAFCSSCGTPIPRQGSMGIPARRCSNCGAEMEEDASFCSKCGNHI